MSCGKILGRLRGGQGRAAEIPHIMQPSCIPVRSSQHSTVQENQNPASQPLELRRRKAYQVEEFLFCFCLGKEGSKGESHFLFIHPLPPIFSDPKN